MQSARLPIWDRSAYIKPMPTESPSQSTHSSLLHRARQRDAVAWRELVDLYGPLIAWWCRRCRIDDHSVADCVQDVFASVAVALDTFQPKRETGSFRAWLWTITRRKVLDCLRTQLRRPHAIGGSTAVAMIHEVMDGQSIPDEEPSEALQIRELIDRALQQVCDEFENCTWQAFWRSVVDGQSTDIVAAELNVTPATIRQARSRILRRLRQQLGDL